MAKKKREAVKKARRSLKFRIKGTILQKITPLVATLTLIKLIIWWLETQGYWFHVQELGILFTIIGFALGIILSQKIGTTYGKYLDLEKTLFSIQGRLSSMNFFLNGLKKNFGNKAIKAWLKGFLELYHGRDKYGVRKLRKLNETLYQDVLTLGNCNSGL